MQGAQPHRQGRLDITLPTCVAPCLAPCAERFEAGMALFHLPDIHSGEQSGTRRISLPIALLAKDAVFQTRRRDLWINLEGFTQPLKIVGKFLFKSANAG